MFVRSFLRARARAFVISGALLAFATTVSAQPEHQHGPAAPEHQHGSAPGDIPMTREGSGTSWLPDETPTHVLHRQSGGWMLMLHSSLFLQYLKETGARG